MQRCGSHRDDQGCLRDDCAEFTKLQIPHGIPDTRVIIKTFHTLSKHFSFFSHSAQDNRHIRRFQQLINKFGVNIDVRVAGIPGTAGMHNHELAGTESAYYFQSDTRLFFILEKDLGLQTSISNMKSPAQIQPYV